MDPIAKLARRLRGVERLAMKAATQPQLAYSSIEDGAIQSVEDGSLKAIIGKQYDGTQAITIVNGPIPPEPTAPTGTAGIEGATFRWDGVFVDNAVVPMDFSRVELHVSTDPALTGLLAETLRATFETPRGGEVFIGLAPVTQYARLVTRTLTGQASAASDVFTVTPVAISEAVSTASDGDVPVIPFGWTPKVGPFAIGALIASWDVVPNLDPVIYDVYIAAGAPVSVFDSTTYVGATSGTSKSISTLPDDTRLDPTVEYHVAIIPRDADGPAISAGDAGPASPRQADNLDISADYGYFGDIEVSQLRSGDLSAEVAVLDTLHVGNITIDPTTGITIPQTLGGDTHLSSDGTGNQFTGQATFDAVDTLDRLTIRGLLNNLNGLLTMSQGVPDPQQKLTVSSDYETYVLGPGSAYNRRGLYVGTTGAIVTTDNFAGSTSYLQFYDAAGGYVWAEPLPAGYEAWGGVTRIGAFYYILAKIGGVWPWRILKYDAATLDLISDDGFAAAGVQYASPTPSIGNDGTNLLIAGIYTGGGGTALRVYTVDQNSGYAILATRTSTTNFSSVDVISIQQVALGGADRFVASNTSGHYVYDITSSTVITRNSSLDWPKVGSISVCGLYYADGHFSTVSNSRIYHYTTNQGAWDFSYTWADTDAGGLGEAESALAPIQESFPVKYARWGVSLPSAPPDDGTNDGANTAILYANLHGDGLVQQHTLADGVLSHLFSGDLVTTGVTPPGSSEFEARPSTSSGKIQSTASDGAGPIINLDGSGPGRAGPLSWDEDGKNVNPIQISGTGGTYSPTSAVTNATPAGVADFVFTAPTSGRVHIMMALFILSKSSAASTTAYIRVREGATLRAGTIVSDDADDGIANYGTTYIKGWAHCVLDNLTPGASYNVHPVCTTGAGAGATWTLGHVKVVPLS